MSEKCKTCKFDNYVARCVHCDDFYENITGYESLYEKGDKIITKKHREPAVPIQENYLFEKSNMEDLFKPRNRKERRHGREI